MNSPAGAGALKNYHSVCLNGNFITSKLKKSVILHFPYTFIAHISVHF